MAAIPVYSGPGKLVFNGVAFQPDGENGPLNAVIDEKKTSRGTAMFGHVRDTLDDQTVKISTTPFDDWGLLGTVLPTYLGVTTAAGAGTVPGGAGVLAIGTRPHDFFGGGSNALAPAKVWTADGRLYNWVRAAITKHPSMKLGVGQTLFEGMELTGIGAAALDPGTSGFLLAGNAITESAATDPDTVGYATTGFINGPWSGAYGAVTGFTTMQAEDFWHLQVDVKYDALTVQKCTRHFKLASAKFMIKARLAGPTHTQLAGLILAHTLGQTLQHGTATDLVLTGPSAKTVTLKNCEPVGAGFEFGGTRLGTGEVGFVTSLAFTAGAAQPTLIFSA